MACFQVHKLVVSLPPVLLLLMIMCSLLSTSSHAKPSKCSCSDDEDGRRKTATRNIDITFDTMLEIGYLFVDNNSSWSNSSALLVNVNNTISPSFNNSNYNGSFILPSPFPLWKTRDDGKTNLEANSFNVSFSMSISHQLNKVGRLTFAILPSWHYFMITPPSTGSLTTLYGPSSPRAMSDSYISINISVVDSTLYAYPSNSIWIEISIQPPQNSIAATTSNYTVWIGYDRDVQKLSVYASEGEPTAMPDSPIATASRAIISSSINTSFSSYFAFFSSMEQLLQLHTWNSTFDVFLLPDIDPSGGKMSTARIVSVAVGSSVAVAVLVATTVYCYFNSTYRRWKKDFDQLAKSMQRLPGVPIQVNFSDIQKATNNFHETMKLGQGGFGAVYRCMLPASVKAGGGEALEVAVKKFTRDDNRRYEDFLAEVSVINRLRHKNIVPLIGWSYNKGEPLLIYDYMPNGSLDQHLYRRSGDKQQRSPICQWDTRYNIVKDVATGLQYAHHEYEPVVLHRDIKASNILIDSVFHGRLGDFGLACTVDMGKNSYTERGGRPLGTCGFVADEYRHSGRATTETDIFAFGVLILETVTGKPPLETVTGKRPLENNAPFDHITDWVWSLHREGKLLDAVDPVLTTGQQFDGSDAKRLLLLALACSSPNPSERPSMMEALQVITKLAPAPEVPLEKPRFVWPPEGFSTISSDCIGSANSNLERSLTTAVEMATRRHVSFENAGNSMQHRPIGRHSQEQDSFVYRTAQLSGNLICFCLIPCVWFVICVVQSCLVLLDILSFVYKVQLLQ